MNMNQYRVIQDPDERSAALGAQAVACPTCSVRFVFCRSRNPVIDACGFESYALECHECGASLAGIVDPFDDTLSLADLAA